MSKVLVFAVALPLLSALPADAAVQVSNTTQINQGFAVSNSDLAQTNIASIQTTGVFTAFGSAGAVALNNGSFGTVGASLADVALTSNSTITFNFVSPRNIGEIATYAGWDTARGGQSYTVSYATAGDPLSFNFLVSVFNQGSGDGFGNVSTRAVITDTSGVLASDVARIRFSFGSGIGTLAYREIDIFAAQVAPIPEPASWAMMIGGFGMVGAVARRRRTYVTMA